MSKRGVIFLCTTDDTCPEHGKYIYYCGPCHDRWAAANPRTVAAINKGASKQAVDKARKADHAARQEAADA